MDLKYVVMKLCLRPEENQSYIEKLIEENDITINDLRKYTYVPPFLLRSLKNVPHFLHTSIYDHKDNLSILLEKELQRKFETTKDAFLDIWNRSYHDREVMKTDNPLLISLYLETFQNTKTFPPAEIVPQLTDGAIFVLAVNGFKMSSSDEKFIKLGLVNNFVPEKYEHYLHSIFYNQLIYKHIIETNDLDTFQKCIGDRNDVVRQCIAYYFINKTPNLEPYLENIDRNLIYQALIEAGARNTLFDVEKAIETKFFTNEQIETLIVYFELNPLKYKDQYDVSKATHTQLEKQVSTYLQARRNS